MALSSIVVVKEERGAIDPKVAAAYANMLRPALADAKAKGEAQVTLRVDEGRADSRRIAAALELMPEYQVKQFTVFDREPDPTEKEPERTKALKTGTVTIRFTANIKTRAKSEDKPETAEKDTPKTQNSKVRTSKAEAK